MNELISLHQQTINGEPVETVNAKELYVFLEVRSKFADWIKNRISEYDFVENQDFTTVSKNLENGGRTIEYYTTLKMAKELAMVERNERGKQARRYFIECEERLKANQQVQSKQLPQTNAEYILMLAQQLVEQERKSAELDNRLQVVEQKQQQLDQDNDHFTINGFCSLHGLDLSNGKMSALSKKAKKLSDVKDYMYHEITDPRWARCGLITETF